MGSKFRYASTLAVAMTFVTCLISAEGSGAIAQSYEPAIEATSAGQLTSEPMAQPLATAAMTPEAAPDKPAPIEQAETAPEPLAEAEKPEALTPELKCLAGAIYFESKGEPLDGQLAVGRVIVARARSGRFPASYCGVVYQPSQFSFVRGHAMPRINTGSRDWANAVQMAKLADTGSRRTKAEGALFFHAKRVSPSWRLTRVASIGNHVFYR